MTTTQNTNTAAASTPNFQFFEGTLSENNSTPRITVRRGGLIVITRAAVDMMGSDVAHVQLAYDAKTGAVGIRAVAEDTAGSYRLRTQPKSPSRLVSGKRFFQHHGLTIRDAKSYTAQDFGNGIVGFNLDAGANAPESTEAVEAAPVPKKTTDRKAKTTA